MVKARLSRGGRSIAQRIALVLVVLLLLGAGVVLLYGTPYSGCGHGNDRSASTSLKTIALAQFDFCSGDRDWNDVKDFWRKDIAGLYTLYPAADATHTPIKLIELSIASADDRPVSDLSPYALPSTKAGYWFRALLHEDEKTPSPDRFAVCAYPDSPSAGRWTYIVDEENFIYRKELKNQRGVERYPADPIKAGWQRLD